MNFKSRQIACGMLIGSGIALVAVLWAGRERTWNETMTELERRIQCQLAAEDVETYHACEDAIVLYLKDHPELDAAFFERYVIRPAAEGGDVGFAAAIFAFLGRERPFNHLPFLRALYRDDVDIHDKRRALFCITQIADHLNESEIFDLMDHPPEGLGLSAICNTIDSLRLIRDRDKAARLLRRCLEATDDTSTADGQTMTSLLDNFVIRINGNEDIYRRLLEEPLPPHQKVIVAASLMQETLPVDGPLRDIADEAADQTELANDYFNLYVGIYVAPNARKR